MFCTFSFKYITDISILPNIKWINLGCKTPKEISPLCVAPPIDESGTIKQFKVKNKVKKTLEEDIKL